MRDTTFIHPLGGTIDLPLLVPSFSSKGFDFFTEGKQNAKRIFSRATNALDDLARYLQESYLLSAYDLHHKHFRRPYRFFNDTALIFLDSGGYELNPEFDSSEPKITPIRKLDFIRDDYVNTLSVLYEKHNERPFVIANFDWGTKNQSFKHQIDDARTIFSKHPKWASNFILKPHTPTGKVIDVDYVVPVIEELRGFNVIGVTEKELGKNLIDRLRRLAKLRLELNKRNVRAPIHVWGGLDPLITPLYFFAGANMFDGVSWLRYAYHDGVAVNRESYPVLSGSLTLSNDHSIALAINNNLMVLQGIATSLRTFASSETPNFNMFDGKGDFFEKAYRTMNAKIPELKELL
jgi:hypothetical protein